MPQPPTGTVTFLFTDIEGSTRLWERHPDAMRPALARHDALLADAIARHGGHVFKTVGDAFCAAFPTANGALGASLAAQLALLAEPWGLPAPLRVRMGLHTGVCEERGGDYFGPPLNRVARLMSAGAGGQTLLSEATQALVRDHLPPGAALEDLGRHRLKDLGRPEQVFQLLHPALPAGFPPLRSLDNPALPNNLPPQTTSFVGREKELAEVKALLGTTRLLTLTGAGGGGKTRLSLQAAADLLTGDGDGVWLVELAALADPALVPQAVANVLGVREQAGQPVQRTLTDALKPQCLLLILDNCEHVVAACASLAAELLRHCPGVHILASSREPLNVAGERTYRVPPLSLPDPKGAQTVEASSQFEAVRLFIERAQAVQPGFAMTTANAPAVAQVCRRLDGIPLALELAAARVRSLSVEEVNSRLNNRFRLLTGGARDRLPRQQTLRALVDWSYDLLTEGEKTLLCRLSVFAGGWSLSAAEAVCAGGDVEDWEVLDGLTALADKSLVVYDEGAGGDGRYRLLETVRQYAGDRLAEGGDAEALRERAAAWFLGLAEQAEAQLKGPEQAAWLSRLEAEHDNLRAALSWSEQRPGGAETMLRLTGALWRFWWMRGFYSEGRQWLERALARTDESGGGPGSAARAGALSGAGNLALASGDLAAATTLHGESLALRRRLGDRQGVAHTLGNLGVVAHLQGDLGAARALHEQSLAIRRDGDDQQGVAHALTNIGIVASAEADYPGARACYEESLLILRRLGDQRGIAAALSNLGVDAARQGDHAGARALHEESLAILRSLGDQQGVASTLINLGEAACAEADYSGAQAFCRESLLMLRQLSAQIYVPDCLAGLAGAALGQGRASAATRLLAAASALRETVGAPLEAVVEEEIAMRVAAARAALGEDAFAADWAAGQALTMEQAVEYALSLPVEPAPPGRGRRVNAPQSSSGPALSYI